MSLILFKMMNQGELLTTNDDLNFNYYLLSLLEQCESLNIFADSCCKLLRNKITITNLRIAQYNKSNYSPLKNNFNYCYHLQILEKESHYLKTLQTWIESNHNILIQGIPLNFERESSVCGNYSQSSLLDFGLAQVVVFPLQFKDCFLGCLIIESEEINQSIIANGQDADFGYLIAKYVSIYLYQTQLIKRQDELKKQEEQLLESQEKQSKYLSYMNHELRSPIASVIGFAKMLKQKLYGDLNSKQLQYVEAIYESGNYLLGLVSDLLDIAKIEAKKEELYLEKTLINELCESSLAIVQTKAEEQNLELNLMINSYSNYCIVDPIKVKQILVNLLSNAVKFTETGSVTLKVENDEQHLNFYVIDTGIGICKLNQGKLFKPFSQLNTHLHKKHKGSGLGLTIARELAKLHGGDITLTSEENKGSCFTLSLPHNENCH